MTQTQRIDLPVCIHTSILLPDEIKQELLALLPIMTPAQKEMLTQMLEQEEDAILGIVAQMVEHAREMQNSELLETLNDFLQTTMQTHQKATEKRERPSEEDLKSLFEDL